MVHFPTSLLPIVIQAKTLPITVDETDLCIPILLRYFCETIKRIRSEKCSDRH